MTMTDNEQPSAIIGVTKTCRTYTDGSLVIQIEVEPRHAQAAFALFGAPGTPVAVARIYPEVAQQQARKEAAEQLKGGVLAKLAGMFCDAEPFRAWLRMTYDPLPRSADDAATILRNVCGITSRAELDHDAMAAHKFHTEFRLPYNAWLKDQP